LELSVIVKDHASDLQRGTTGNHNVDETEFI